MKNSGFKFNFLGQKYILYQKKKNQLVLYNLLQEEKKNIILDHNVIDWFLQDDDKIIVRLLKIQDV